MLEYVDVDETWEWKNAVDCGLTGRLSNSLPELIKARPLSNQNGDLLTHAKRHQREARKMMERTYVWNFVLGMINPVATCKREQ